MPFNDSSSALVAVVISNPYADAGNVGPENLGPQWGYPRKQTFRAACSMSGQ